MAELQKYSMVNALDEADKKYMNDPSLLGITALTYPTYINAMRGTMWCSHSRQFLDLLEPEFPAVFTNMENLVGEYSDGYKKAKHNYKVYRKVYKYNDIVKDSHIYHMFYYDMEQDKYDVMEVRPFTSLTENFGYQNINDTIDAFEEGDIINEGTILQRSASYDPDMNYGFGLNANVAFVLDPYTSEDAAKVREGFCEKFRSVEVDTNTTIGLNTNDFMINLHGDEDHYKPLPDIGEKTSVVFCAVRREFLNQVLSDFKSSALLTTNDTDVRYFADNDSVIVDYDIYDNTEERMDDNPFLEQVYKYLDSQTKYYQELHDTCEEIINSGKAYSNDIDYLLKRSGQFINREDKWASASGGTFAGIEIAVHYARVRPLTKGCKFTGKQICWCKTSLIAGSSLELSIPKCNNY